MEKILFESHVVRFKDIDKKKLQIIQKITTFKSTSYAIVLKNE